MFNRIIALIIKELHALFRDPKRRRMLFVMPLIQLSIFSFAATLEVKNVNLAVVNNDNGNISRDLIRKFYGSQTFKNIYYLKSYSEANEFINTQKVIAAVAFRQDFSKNITNKESSVVQIILDGRKSNNAQIVQGYISRIVDQFNLELADEYNLLKNQNIVSVRTWFNPNTDYIWFTIPSLLGILILTLGLVVTGLSVARERELGTFDQLLVSPIQPFEILVGKTVPAIVVGIIETFIMLPAAVFIFKVPFTGSFLLLMLSVFIFLLAVIGLGLFLSSISKTQQQAVLGSFMFSAPAIALSGFSTPIENMPEWLQILTLANPLRYFMVITRGTFVKNIPFETVMENLIPMFIISVVTLTGAAWFFRRRLE